MTGSHALLSTEITPSIHFLFECFVAESKTVHSISFCVCTLENLRQNCSFPFSKGILRLCDDKMGRRWRLHFDFASNGFVFFFFFGIDFNGERLNCIAKWVDDFLLGLFFTVSTLQICHQMNTCPLSWSKKRSEIASKNNTCHSNIPTISEDFTWI